MKRTVRRKKPATAGGGLITANQIMTLLLNTVALALLLHKLCSVLLGGDEVVNLIIKT